MFVCCVHDGAIPVCLCAVYMMLIVLACLSYAYTGQLPVC